MFKLITPIIVAATFIKMDKNGNVADPVVIDQYSGQEFNKNEYGWPRSDVSAIMEADSLQIQDRLLSRLQLLKDDPSNAGKTDKELVRDLIPRNVQSFGELSAYMKWYQAKFGELLFSPEEQQKKVVEEEEKEKVSPTSVESAKS